MNDGNSYNKVYIFVSIMMLTLILKLNECLPFDECMFFNIYDRERQKTERREINFIG